MQFLKARQEEDKRRLESRFRADMEAQKVQMQNLLKANIERLQKENQVVVDQKQSTEEYFREHAVFLE